MPLRQGEVQGQRLGCFLLVGRRLGRDLGDARVQLAPAPEREALVGGVADQRMPEVEGAGGVRVALDELPQPVPRLGVEGGVGIVLEHPRDELAREARAEDGRPAEQRAVCPVRGCRSGS